MGFPIKFCIGQYTTIVFNCPWGKIARYVLYWVIQSYSKILLEKNKAQHRNSLNFARAIISTTPSVAHPPLPRREEKRGRKGKYNRFCACLTFTALNHVVSQGKLSKKFEQ